jgi:hypothetical protein
MSTVAQVLTNLIKQNAPADILFFYAQRIISKGC